MGICGHYLVNPGGSLCKVRHLGGSDPVLVRRPFKTQEVPRKGRVDLQDAHLSESLHMKSHPQWTSGTPSWKLSALAIRDNTVFLASQMPLCRLRAVLWVFGWQLCLQ